MANEPIAIVGIGCRFPGAPDVESFWRVLRDGIETVGDYPGQRFQCIDRVFSPEAVKSGSIATRRGGFLPNLDQFDSEFFGISPREAALLDPQQRLALEVGWEAVEDAGIPPVRLTGSRTGVFVGLWNSDYERCIFDLSRDLDFYATTGGGRYPASGRLAYVFDLRGPNLTVDTACSSSLVAIHLACASLRKGESEMALAGGVNAILRPEITLSYSAAKMLSPEGRCKFGDAAAAGYVRSEGAAIVFLEPLSRAIANGDPVYAVIRGSAVNNDGRSSGSLIAPSREGQADMLRSALRDAGVAPHEINYIEAHGTGTLAGDPVELGAISDVVADGARTQPCLVGSVKTNLGHTESAAGAAGVIKVALSLQRGVIPASLHFREPNPRIDWSKGAVAIPAQATPWPAGAAAPIAGVSGFGITGTNAHVVLQRGPASEAKRDNEIRPHVFLLSAHTPAALEGCAASWRDRLLAEEAWPASLADLAYTAGARRAHQDFRLALVACTRQELLDRINGFLDKQEQSGVRSGKRLAEEKRRTVFVFPGQGGQWLGMGRSLLRTESVFQQAMARCDEAIRKYTGWSATDRLTQSDDATSLAGIDVVQPVLFAVTVSLAELWRSFGVEPEAVVGHSMGEAAAAAVCGALSLDDAAAVICHRSRFMKGASGLGLMAVAELSMEDAEKFARDYAGRISVAANNSPTSTVLSGDAAAIEDAFAKLEAREIFCRRIKVDVASHCAHMDPFREELARSLTNIQPRRASIPFYSTTSDAIEDGSGLDANYWSRNLRQPVLFSSAVQKLLADGFDTFVEVNPHPVLLQAIEDGIRHAQRDAVAVASLRRDKDERSEMLDALGALYVSGFPVDLARLYPQGTCLRLPAYPWQRERHWIEEDELVASPGRAAGAHPNLGVHIASSVEPGAHLWEVNLRTAQESGDAAAVLVELGLAAASEALGTLSCVLEDLNLSAPSEKDRAGQMVIVPSGKDCWSLRISAKTDSGWSPRCTGTIRRVASQSQEIPLGECRERVLEDQERELLRECLRLAAEAIEERFGPGPYRVSKIARIARQDAETQGKRIARARHIENSGLGACCRLEMQGGPAVLDLCGIQFEHADEPGLADSIYQLRWVPTELPPKSDTAKSAWILFGEPGGLTAQFGSHLGASGARWLSVSDSDRLHDALESLGANCAGILCLPRAIGADPRYAARETFRVVKLVQALAKHKGAAAPRLWLVTNGAWNLPGDSAEVSVSEGPLWGLGRVISAEYPELRCVNLDCSVSPSTEEMEALSVLLSSDLPDEQVALRGRNYFVARYERSPFDSSAELPRFAPDATYLITGGLGGIALKVAEWSVKLGARHLALVGRRGPSSSASEQIEKLKAAGAAVRVFSADVAEPDQLKSVLQTIEKEMPPLRGVFHMAVVVDGALLTDVTEERIDGVMRPKAAGAWNLHCQIGNAPLDFFVLFSSIAAVMGQPGLTSYASANAFLDALARYRHAKGLKALSIQWAPWAAIGLGTDEKIQRGVSVYLQQGVRRLALETAMGALEQVMCQDAAGRLILPIRWREFARSFADSSVPPVFAALVPQDEVITKSQQLQATIRETLLAAVPGRPRRALLENHLQEILASVLKTSASRLDPVKPLGSMGVDSLMALQFVRRIGATTSVRLPATAVFNYPTLRLLAVEIARRMEIPLDAEVQPASTPSAPESLAAVPDEVANLTEEETIQALLQGGREN
jgi:acyl transferase domain-containing protein/NADP-dependent 3-hydroxy acid dehydrogenase YdfG/acyl carrier protein